MQIGQCHLCCYFTVKPIFVFVCSTCEEEEEEEEEDNNLFVRVVCSPFLAREILLRGVVRCIGPRAALVAGAPQRRLHHLIAQICYTVRASFDDSSHGPVLWGYTGVHKIK